LIAFAIPLIGDHFAINLLHQASPAARSLAALTAGVPLSRLWDRAGAATGRKRIGSHRIAALPGDGIGQEVIAAGADVLQALAARESRLDWGSAWCRAHGRLMPDDGLDQLRGFDVIHFGAAGAPDIPDDVTF
jgi:hypothetical protein